MKALTCEMCGSTNLVKEGGVFVCQSCGTKYSVEEAKKIVAQPFAQEEELNAKSDRLEMLTDELNKAAQEAKKNNPEKKRTNYFDSAKLKKEAAKSRAKILSAPKKDKEINRGGDVLGE